VIDHEELVLAGHEPNPLLLELTEEIAERLQAGEAVDAADYVRHHPEWAGAIRGLLPTMHDLVAYGRHAGHHRGRGPHRDNPDDAGDHRP
jgi:hypothetical protein